MLLSGVYTPACILSSLRDFGLGEWTHEPCVPTKKISRHSFIGCLLFFDSLLLLDIPEGTERFAILGIGLWDLSDGSEGIG